MKSNLWNIISIINNENLSMEDIKQMATIDFNEVKNEYLKTKNYTFDLIKCDNMDEEEISLWNSKIDAFIFEGERIFLKNIDRDKNELMDYIMVIKPLNFDAVSFFLGLTTASRINMMCSGKC